MDDEHEVSPNSPGDPGVEEPPVTIPGILRRLGPGSIIAGSIVGSGELIATTATGAEAGFYLLWLVVIGCVVKVFTQVELGRYTIVSGETTMQGMDSVPGPRLGRRGNWVLWFWFLMFVVSLGQIGGIVGGVGQALAISAPLTEAGRTYNRYVDARTRVQVGEKSLAITVARGQEEKAARIREDVETARAELDAFTEAPPEGRDDEIWATLVTVLTAVLLVLGRYRLIQALSAFFVAAFTFITVGNLLQLQADDTWAVTLDEFLGGLSFRLPPTDPVTGIDPLFTALAAFGIIGVGANELIQYPYWCLEKGYARFTGPRDSTDNWARRARGWMRVMQWDAWCSMVVYTFATIAFYLLGAAVLGRTGLNPEGSEMVRTLAVMYEPVFGRAAELLFLFGAIAVLYSTFFVATAGHARVTADAVRIFGLGARTKETELWWVRVFSVVFPFLCLFTYLFYQQPLELVLAGGVMQALMLPILAVAALWFRYRRSDHRMLPGRIWDLCLWVSGLAMLLAGVALIAINVRKVL